MISIVEVIALVVGSTATTGMLYVILHLIKKSNSYDEICKLEKIALFIFWFTGISWLCTAGVTVIWICQRLSS